MRVWTFLIRGGDLLPIRLSMRGTPTLDHEGGTTLWKMVGSEVQASAVQEFLASMGCHVERYTEEQSPEQEAERLRLVGRGE